MRWIVVADHKLARVFVIRSTQSEICRVHVAGLPKLLERAWLAGRYTELAMMMPATVLAEVRFKMGPARETIVAALPEGADPITDTEIARDTALLTAP